MFPNNPSGTDQVYCFWINGYAGLVFVALWINGYAGLVIVSG